MVDLRANLAKLMCFRRAFDFGVNQWLTIVSF
jgi:hypothetical protein